VTLSQPAPATLILERAIIRAFLTGISAAQNGPVTRLCPNCRALLLTSTENCSFCEPRSNSPALRRIAQESAQQIALDAGDPLWRKEVNRRLSDYRARRRSVSADIDLPAIEESEQLPSPIPPRPQPRPRSAAAGKTERMPERKSDGKSERFDICVQPELDFSHFQDDRVHPQTALVPVATLRQRRKAGVLDASFIALTCAGFLGLFHSLGGSIQAGKLDALVCGAVLFLFYAVYILLFTVLNAATPGMQIAGLNTVRLDGTQPNSRQLVWRGFGYLLSGITLGLGYCWCLWDEDHFTWHDRISHTYLSSSPPLA
jgi:uncharacterized RDD family membrane protein YckC